MKKYWGIQTRYVKWIISIGYIAICAFILFSFFNGLSMKISVAITLIYSFGMSNLRRVTGKNIDPVEGNK